MKQSFPKSWYFAMNHCFAMNQRFAKRLSFQQNSLFSPLLLGCQLSPHLGCQPPHQDFLLQLHHHFQNLPTNSLVPLKRRSLNLKHWSLPSLLNQPHWSLQNLSLLLPGSLLSHHFQRLPKQSSRECYSRKS